MTVRVLTAPTWMTRASTCASGMNSSSEPSHVQEPAEQAHAVADLEQEVAVGELAALGPAGGAAGVDQRGQAVGVQRGAAGVELAVGDVLAGLDQLVDGAVVDDVDRPQVRRLVAHGLDGRGVLVLLDDDRRWRRSRTRIQATWSALEVS